MIQTYDNVLLVFFGVFILLSATTRAQEQDRVITTGVPFLLIATDARGAGMGDQGVAIPVDAFSYGIRLNMFLLRKVKELELITRPI